MAFHHQNTHYYHHHQQPLHHQQQSNSPACHCGCSSQPPLPPPPSQPSPSPFSQCNPPNSDPLLIQSIVTQILQSSPPPPPPPSHHLSPSPQCNPPYSIDPLLIQSIVTQILQSSQPPPPPENHLYPKFLKPQKQQQKQTQNQEEKRTRSLLKNLHSRIDALESYLHHLSTSSSSSSHSLHNQPSLRDLAARIIQIHFRAFLVRRSRTLRYLKNLAFIKSSFNSLKSSLSGNNNNSQLNHSALSQKAMDLLLKLDSVQGGDPMIRDGKRLISRDLVRFLEFIDSITVKRQQISSKSMKNVRIQTGNNQEFRVCHDQGGNPKVLDKLNQRIQNCYRVIDDENGTDDDEEEEGEIEDLHPVDDEQENSRNPNYGILVKRPNVSVKLKKNVKFADDEQNVFVCSSGSQDSDSDVVSIGGGGNDQRQFVESLSRNADEIVGGYSSKVSEDDDDEGASQSSNGSEGSTREYVKTEVMNNNGSNKQFSNGNGNFLFSPPMPVTMEPKIDDLMSRRK
ncbi:hypothetical protein MKX03_016780 [Papaver bracteatum]|nr:hypothetical protein MKX03_016780 [Papaver bracteatum]